MGRRTVNNKQLKRVNGDLQLAPVKLDFRRPPTAGLHIKRCDNDISFPVHTGNNSIKRLVSEEFRIGAAIQPSFYSVRSRENLIYELSLLSETTEDSQRATKYSFRKGPLTVDSILPESSERCSEIRENESSLRSTDDTNTRKPDHDESGKAVSLFPSISLCSDATDSSMKPPLSKFLSDITYKTMDIAIAIPSTKTISEGGIKPPEPRPIKKDNVERPKGVISTATTLQLPGSDREIPSCGESISPVWSTRGEIGTAKGMSKAEVKTVSPSPSSSEPQPSNSSTSSIQKEKQGGQSGMKNNQGQEDGGGDTMVSGSTGEDTETLPGGPPGSPATSGSDKPPFMLTFRRPKPLPRSRITSTAGSTRCLLPTTASAPSPFSQSHPNTAIETDASVQDTINNNSAQQPDLNNNREDDQLNNNQLKGAESKNKLSATHLALAVEEIQKGNEIIALVGAAQAGPPKKTEIEEQLAQAIGETSWKSTELTASEPKPVQRKKKRKGSKVAETYSREFSSTNSGSINSTPSSYPYSQQQQPCIITEKGAIRFHLPGRIQHKTTIKVAHFPTGDDKNIILNVKPECEEETIEVPVPECGINNQNFYMPPPPPMQMPDPSCGYTCPPPPCGPYSYPTNPYCYNPYYYGYQPPYC